MEETRQDLKDKLETLEQQVKNTVQGATEAVSETVETVKETVKGTVETVKETVEETMEGVKETFNIRKHVQNHPWPAFACATVAGFVGTRLLLRLLPETERETAPPYTPPSYYTSPAPSARAEPGTPAAARPGWWSWLTEHYSDELNKLKGLAVATAGGVIREMLTENVTPEIGERIKEVVDGITVKLGGQPIEGPILDTSGAGTAPAKERKREEYTPKTERFMGTGSR
jgi:ElaB/YqjD/DUF883 family membrane-anchored ribosome-binding protein